jgi:hypothetical protein
MVEIRAVRGETLDEAVDFVWGNWGGPGNREFYADCMAHSLDPDGLPVFFLAYEEERIIGCIALLACDLVSRQDRMPADRPHGLLRALRLGIPVRRLRRVEQPRPRLPQENGGPAASGCR